MIEDLKVLLGLPEEIDEELENKLLLILKASGYLFRCFRSIQVVFKTE